MNRIILYLPILLSLMIVSSCIAQQPVTSDVSAMSSAAIKLIEKRAHLSMPRKNLRKWDSPVVVDLDQDGYQDLILNDHGLGVQICWNNKGRYAKPYDLLMGDVHGVAVADIDDDGRLDLLLSRGGGSGGNARNTKLYEVDTDRTIEALPDFEEPLATMRGRTVIYYDGDNDGDADLINFAFPSREKKGKSENYIYRNTGSTLILQDTLPAIRGDGQKTLPTDYDGDGIIDLLVYGHGHVKCYRGNGDLSYKDMTDSVLPDKISDVTTIHEVDYDNDGDFDLYMTRGRHFEIGETFYDADRRLMGFHTSRGAFDFSHILTGDILQITNYHTQWPHINELYIGETGYDYEHEGELHSGKDLRLVNSNALGFPDRMKDMGIHIGYIGNQEWRIAGRTRSSLTGVTHDVQSWTESEHQPGLIDVLLRNDGGRYHDVTAQLGLDAPVHTNVATSADLDGDGWQDLIIIPRGDLIDPLTAMVYRNIGGQRYELLQDHGIHSAELGALGMAIAATDYDHDGDIDIITGHERGQWHLYQNQMNDPAQYLSVQIGPSPDHGATALHALVTVEGCGIKQTRRVGSSSVTYSQSADRFLSFGVGYCDRSHTMTIRWTNGEQHTQSLKPGVGYVVVP